MSSLYSVRPTRVVRDKPVRIVRGLSTHYVPVVAGRRAKGFAVAVATAGGPAPAVSLVVGGPHGRIVAGRPIPGRKLLGRSFVVRFGARERRAAMLVITSGRAVGAHYRISSRALY